MANLFKTKEKPQVQNLNFKTMQNHKVIGGKSIVQMILPRDGGFPIDLDKFAMVFCKTAQISRCFNTWHKTTGKVLETDTDTICKKMKT
jgi:hypothetical protein